LPQRGASPSRAQSMLSVTTACERDERTLWKVDEVRRSALPFASSSSVCAHEPTGMRKVSEPTSE
jgi:hypothetical protein